MKIKFRKKQDVLNRVEQKEVFSHKKITSVKKGLKGSQKKPSKIQTERG